jgi:excisionase family DNA binding protein
MKKHPVTGVRMPAGCTCVRRAAEQLDCDVRTVRRFIHNRKLRADRIGLRYWAIVRDDVVRLALRRAAQ